MTPAEEFYATLLALGLLGLACMVLGALAMDPKERRAHRDEPRPVQRDPRDRWWKQ